MPEINAIKISAVTFPGYESTTLPRCEDSLPNVMTLFCPKRFSIPIHAYRDFNLEVSIRWQERYNDYYSIQANLLDHPFVAEQGIHIVSPQILSPKNLDSLAIRLYNNSTQPFTCSTGSPIARVYFIFVPNIYIDYSVINSL